MNFGDNNKEAKKDEGVKVTLSLNNEMLASMISAGIQDLPKEVIHTLAYDALKTALEDKEFVKHLLFRSGNSGYSRWDEACVQPWVAELLSKSFTDEEVKMFRDGVLEVLKTDHKDIAVRALSSCFMRRLSEYDFTDSVKMIVHDVMANEMNNGN